MYRFLYTCLTLRFNGSAWGLAFGAGYALHWDSTLLVAMFSDMSVGACNTMDTNSA